MDGVISDLKKLKIINTEIKRLNEELKTIREEKKQSEKNILDYIHDNDLPGIKFGNIVILAEEKNYHSRLKKAEKEKNITELLSRMGIMDTKAAYQKLMEAMKGEASVKNVIKIKEGKVSE